MNGFTPGTFYAGTEPLTPGALWYVAEGGGGPPDFMDGVMTEEEWMRRRRIGRRWGMFRVKRKGYA